MLSFKNNSWISLDNKNAKIVVKEIQNIFIELKNAEISHKHDTNIESIKIEKSRNFWEEITKTISCGLIGLKVNTLVEELVASGVANSTKIMIAN